MEKFTENQTQYLLTFFENDEYTGWKNIALKLITNGKCIVAGEKCIWNGGIGNFIETKNMEDAIGCLQYEFNVDNFMNSNYFKELINNKISQLSDNKRRADEEYNDICNL